jgi:PST family polysaccharide transporter
MAEAAVIQSLGHSFMPVIITIVGVGSKWALNLVLVPHYEIAGAASATVLAYLIMTVLFYVVLRVHIKKTLIEKRHVLIILKSTVYMGAVVILFNCLFEWMSSGDSRLLATVQALIGVGIGAVVFVMTAIRAGLFGEEELSLIPAGSKLKRFIITNRSIRNHE